MSAALNSLRPIPGLAFRPAVASDALCIGVLATQVFLDTYATDGIRPTLAREVLEFLSTDAVTAQLAAPDLRFIVAEREGHLVGFAQLTMGAEQPLVPARSSAQLNRLYVQERFTGRGIGAALLACAQALAWEEGAAVLWLTAWVGNERALAFYPRQGYADVGPSIYEFQGERHENRVFAKTLHESGINDRQT
jgi:GNAT superfamily N-acetyltransferase